MPTTEKAFETIVVERPEPRIARMLRVVPEYLNSRAYSIFGGSSETQRDILAKMVREL